MGETSSWLFRLNRILHRDIGFLCVGLTIVYCISGIALNHVDQWNPTYQIKREVSKLEIGPAGEEPDTTWALEVCRRLKPKETYRNFFQSSPVKVRIFLENSIIDVNLKTLEATYEKVVERPILADFNFLHLNKSKKLWTAAADVYAVFLLYLAISGLFMVKGDRGFFGRGGWLTLLGFVIPLVFLLLYKF